MHGENIAGNLENFAEIIDAQKHYHSLQYQHWLHYEVFTYSWWLLIVLLIIPWIIWWRLVDKNKLGIILGYGFYMLFIITAMDATGLALKLWIYPIKLLPVVPDSIGIDWGLLTVTHMLIYQYFPKWKSFIVAETITAAFFAFIGEPITMWLGLYFPLHWYHLWSFPIYLLKAVIGKLLIDKITCSK